MLLAMQMLQGQVVRMWKSVVVVNNILITTKGNE